MLGLGGLLLLNVLLLSLACWCSVLFCRAQAGRTAGTLAGLAFVGASVVPVYAVWLTPEILNFTLVLVAYFLWAYKKVAGADAPKWLGSQRLDWAAAALLGIATFSKPPNALLIAPLVAVAAAHRRWARVAGLAAVFCLVVGALFGATALVSGDWNYQGGGDRSTFYSHFPFDDQGTRFATGSPMSTSAADDENILAPSYLVPTLRLNIVYFLVGRDAGLVPYFFPGALIALVWLIRARRAPGWQRAVAAACAASALGILVYVPAGWNGAGGPIGNRYFLSIYPTLLFLVPAGAGLLTAAASLLGGLVFVGAILAHPVRASQAVWLNPERWPLRVLPVEFTLMNDLPVFLNRERGKVPVSKDPEVFLYYMDGNTYFQEADGFWVAGPATADIVIRTAEPLTGLDLRLSSPIANEIDVSLDGRRAHVSLRKDEESRLTMRPDPGVKAHGYEVLLRIRTSAGFYPRELEPASRDVRHLGVFVKPTYHVR